MIRRLEKWILFCELMKWVNFLFSIFILFKKFYIFYYIWKIDIMFLLIEI